MRRDRSNRQAAPRRGRLGRGCARCESAGLDLSPQSAGQGQGRLKRLWRVGAKSGTQDFVRLPEGRFSVLQAARSLQERPQAAQDARRVDVGSTARGTARGERLAEHRLGLRGPAPGVEQMRQTVHGVY